MNPTCLHAYRLGIDAGVAEQIAIPPAVWIAGILVLLAPFVIIGYLVVVVTVTRDEARRRAAERTLQRLLQAGLLPRRARRRPPRHPP